MTKSGERLFGGFAVTTVEIPERTKVRSTMYAARYIAVDTLQKKKKCYKSNIGVK